MIWLLKEYIYVGLLSRSEEDLKAMMGYFVEEYKRRGLKVNEDKSKVIVLNGEEG